MAESRTQTRNRKTMSRMNGFMVCWLAVACWIVVVRVVVLPVVAIPPALLARAGPLLGEILIDVQEGVESEYQDCNQEECFE